MDIACRNYSEGKDSTKLYNCLVRFLIDMNSFDIKLEIIFDGIKPRVLSGLFEVDYPDREKVRVNKYYSYRNYGVEEIIRAVKVAKEANCKHDYYFAPFEATPQVFSLHDSF